MNDIANRLAEVRSEIQAAAQGAGRAVSEITLVAVSKKHPSAAIREAYAAGQRDFGENYAQELTEKKKELADLTDLRWHFIGALQSNKARFVVPGCVLIHAMDRLSVLEALSRRATAAGTVAGVLVEVNVGGEASKAGISPDQIGSLLDQAAALPGVRVRGLMCIPPPVNTSELARPFFRTLRELRETLRPHHAGLDCLSMGMSHDFAVAIEEGATHVRAGTAIFGARE